MRRLNSSCRRSIVLVVLALFHWLGGSRVKATSLSLAPGWYFCHLLERDARALAERGLALSFWGKARGGLWMHSLDVAAAGQASRSGPRSSRAPDRRAEKVVGGSLLVAGRSRCARLLRGHAGSAAAAEMRTVRLAARRGWRGAACLWREGIKKPRWPGVKDQRGSPRERNSSPPLEAKLS
jgi:hypothetical protein